MHKYIASLEMMKNTADEVEYRCLSVGVSPEKD